MSGIVSYGVYIPYNRLERKKLQEAFGKPLPSGEKAVANYDEDSITLAVSAAQQCCGCKDLNNIDAVYCATTTSPYKEKQCATTIAAVLDLKRNIRTADLTDSLRAGSAAMLVALDSAEAGHNTLITMSDCRIGAADGQFETNFGDGAVAFLFGSNKVIAKVIDYYSLSVDFHDQWRGSQDIFVRNWEDRFGSTQAYNNFMQTAAEGVMKKASLIPADFSKIVVYGHTPRSQQDIASLLGFKASQVQESYYTEFGNIGTGSAPLMLAGALDEAMPGDKILYLSYGEGCDAIVFEVTEEVLNYYKRDQIKSFIVNKKNTINYEKYLRWKGLLTTEPAKRPKQERSSLPDYYRNYSKNYALYGCKCKECGTPQFPPTRVCVHCQAVDKMDNYRFYGKKAKIVTYTIDYLADSLDPPNVVVVIDFAEGGRMFCNLVDCSLDDISVGMEVKMSFRRLFAVDGVQTYFWKAVLIK